MGQGKFLISNFPLVWGDSFCIFSAFCSLIPVNVIKPVLPVNNNNYQVQSCNNRFTANVSAILPGVSVHAVHEERIERNGSGRREKWLKV